MSKYVTRSQWKNYRNESPFQHVIVSGAAALIILAVVAALTL